MATSSLGITLIADGTQSGTWGDTTNTNWQYMEDAVAGVYGLNLSGGTTYTFGTALLARYAVINVTNAGGNATISFPAVSKVYIISNNSGYSATLQVTGGGGGSVVVANTLTTLVYCDGTNFNSGITGFTGGNLSITGSITASGSITGASFTSPSGVPQFAGGATGQIPYQTATNTTAYTPTPTTGSYLSWNGSAYTWSTGSVTTAANLAGGSTWSIPYQTSPNNTGFLTPSGATPLTLQWNGSAVLWAAGGAVSSFSAGTTGFTPSSPTGSAVVLGGVLNTANGGTQVSSSGASGNVLVSNGTVWTSQSPAAAGIAALTDTNNFTGTNNYSTAASIAMTGSSIGDQRVGVTYSTYSSGLSATSLQLGTSGTGIVYDTASKSIGFLNGGGSNILITPTSGTIGLSNNTIYTSAVDAIKGGSSTAWIATSDIRLKNNIQDYTKGLDLLNQIKPRTWVYNGKGGSTQGAEGLGVVADEIEQVLPSVIRTIPGKLNPEDTEKTDIKHVDTTEITWLLVNAVKELSAKVTALEEQILNLGVK